MTNRKPSSDSELRIESFDPGPCPVQARGRFRGHEWYFRARGGSWLFRLSDDPAVAPIDVTPHGGGFYYEQPYEGPAPNAGHITRREAERLIRRAIITLRDLVPHL